MINYFVWQKAAQDMELKECREEFHQCREELDQSQKKLKSCIESHHIAMTAKEAELLQSKCKLEDKAHEIATFRSTIATSERGIKRMREVMMECANGIKKHAVMLEEDRASN